MWMVGFLRFIILEKTVMTHDGFKIFYISLQKLRIMEEWRDIKGYEGLYQVSNEGEVRSLNYNHTGTIHTLNPSSNNRGYEHVNLFKDGERKMKQIHRLVAEAFIENPDNLPHINHKDENPHNNKVENLEWCTPAYNNAYGGRALRAGKNISKALRGRIPKHTPPKKVYQYTLDGRLVKIWESTSECVKNGYNHVSQCCNGLRTQNKGYRWSYKPL